MVLCMNSRFENNEALVDWELIPLDVAQGVNHLRNVQQMSKVILYGNSGGGVTMSFYQAVAENGPSVCQGPNKLVQCGNNPCRAYSRGRDNLVRWPPRKPDLETEKR